MKLISALFVLLVPTILASQQHNPRFEAVKPPMGNWTLMVSLSDSLSTIKEYMNLQTIQAIEQFRYVDSRIIMKTGNSIKDNIGGLVYDCKDSTYTILKAMQMVDGKLTFIMDHTRDDNLNIASLKWSKVIPKTIADMELKFLCR